LINYNVEEYLITDNLTQRRKKIWSAATRAAFIPGGTTLGHKKTRGIVMPQTKAAPGRRTPNLKT
jgi:hypothetical protein